MRRRGHSGARALVLLGIMTAALCAGAIKIAAQPAKARRIGVLCAVSCRAGDVNTFRDALSKLGYPEGPNLVYELRSAEGRLDRLPDLARELADRRVDIIFTTWGTAAGLAAKYATATIPVVVGSAGDLVASGLVASLNRPESNVTGISSLALDLEGKRLEIIRQILPAIPRVAVFRDSTNPYSVLAIAEQRRAADTLGVSLREVQVHEAGDVDQGFATVAGEGLKALVLHAYLPILASRDRIVERAASDRVVTIYPTREFVDAGGLLSYGTSLDENARRAAAYVDKILKGAKPSDLPVEQPTRFELVINLKTAKALGLDIPPTLLARADEVIE
jgi:putative ABC transport system substrate-binding protein